MVHKFFPNLKSWHKGITLVELVVVVFIIALFSLIVISDFPKIQKQFALSRVTYKLAQDLRSTQDLGLSGVPIADQNGKMITVKGYGIYVDYESQPTKYVVYADVDGDQMYSLAPLYPFCDQVRQDANGTLATDCVIQIIDISKENSNLYIKKVADTNGNGIVPGTSINFRPPNPNINMEDDAHYSHAETNIILGLRSDNSAVRTVSVNSFGLIEVK